MKKHSLLKTLAIVLLIVVLCTYVISSRGNLVSFLEFTKGTASYLGLGDVLIYFVQSFYHFFDTIVFVLVVGAFYGILNLVPAYKSFVNGIAKKFKDNNFRFVAVITIIFALIASLTGINLPLFIFVPFVVAILLAMGNDKLVSLSATVGGILVGFIGGIFTTLRDPSNSYSVSYTTFDKLVGLDSNFTTIIPRIVILILGVGLLIWYIKKHMTNVKDKKVKYDMGEKLELVSKEADKAYSKVSFWPVIVLGGLVLKYLTVIFSTLISMPNWYNLVCNIVILVAVIVLIVIFRNSKKAISSNVMLAIILGCTLLFLILGLTPWSTLFGMTFFDKVHTNLIASLKWGEFSAFENVISSNFAAFGSWSSWGSFLLPMVMLLIMGIIIKFTYKVKFDDIIDGSIEGAKRALPSVLIVAVAYTVLVCSYNNGFMETVVEAAGSNVFLQLIVSMFGSLFGVDLYYTLASTFSPILEAVTDYGKVLAVAFPSVYGLVQLIGPTSLLLIIGLTYFDVPYRTWVKYIWRFVLMLFVIVALTLFVVALI